MAENAESFDLGVYPDGGMEEAPESAEAVVDAAVEEAQGAEPVEAEAAAENDPIEPAEAGVDEGAPETPFFTFRLGGGQEKTFNSAEEANQYFSTWNGRLAKQAEVLKDYQAENQRWAEWYEKNQDLVESAKKAETEQTPEEAANLLKGSDWQYVNQLLARGETTKAMQYLAYKANEHTEAVVNKAREELRAEYNATLGPMKETEQLRTATVELLTAARNSADEYGSPTYPEFQEGTDSFDPEFVATFAGILKNLPTRIALDPDGYGIALAYDRAHRISAGQRQTQTETVSAAGQAVRDAQGRFVKRTEAQATAIGGSPGRTPGTERQPGEQGSVAEFKNAIKNAGKKDSFLGVEY